MVCNVCRALCGVKYMDCNVCRAVHGVLYVTFVCDMWYERLNETPL